MLFCRIPTSLNRMWCFKLCGLTHWGRVTHISVGKLSNIGSDNGLSPGRRQAIIWTNAGISLIGPSGTNFSEIWIWIQTFSCKKLHLKTSSAKWRLFCLGLNELIQSSHFRNLLCTSIIAWSSNCFDNLTEHYNNTVVLCTNFHNDRVVNEQANPLKPCLVFDPHFTEICFSLMICHHMFSQWLDMKQAIGKLLKQYWRCLLNHAHTSPAING